ncbi:MAG TPA: hypothetical protein VMO47_12665 [Rhodothermales bacterium]|nr:hypothetical protein [Rhodothermales bacterium]
MYIVVISTSSYALGDSRYNLGMDTAKEQVRKLLDVLPEDASLEDIQ